MNELTIQEIKNLKVNSRVFVRNAYLEYEGFITIEQNDKYLTFDIPWSFIGSKYYCINWNNYHENFFKDIIQFYKSTNKYEYINETI